MSNSWSTASNMVWAGLEVLEVLGAQLGIINKSQIKNSLFIWE